jgi:hypothetical protein
MDGAGCTACSGGCPSAERQESDALEYAHREWLAAGQLFDYATEPDMVDYAIYSLQAAEKQFVYLWKRARERHEGGRAEGASPDLPLQELPR